MAEEGPIDVLWKGGSYCMLGGVGSIPRLKDGMCDSSGNDHGVGGRISDPGQGCGVGGGMVGQGDGCGMGEGMVGIRDGYGVVEGMVGLGDGCGVDGKGSGVRTTRGVATGRREGSSVGAVLVLGPSVVLGPAGVAASSFGDSGMGGCTRSRRCTVVSTLVMSLWHWVMLQQTVDK